MRTRLFGNKLRKSISQPRNSRPRLEALEDRCLPSAYLVTTTADAGPGSLRDAITQVNADTSHTLYASPSNPSVDEIDFNITAASDTGGGYNATTGVATISPQLGLPNITNAVLIDGYTQAGASPNTLAQGNDAVLKIQLDLSGISSDDGAGVGLIADNSTLRGLVVNGVNNTAIYVGGTGDHIEGNFIGTDVSGATLVGGGSSTTGIYSPGGDGSVVGGLTPDARNIISGFGHGIWMNGAPGSGPAYVIEGNYIGTDANGAAALGNVAGMDVHGAIIADNLISGNQTGIYASYSGHIYGNLIGTDASGMAPLPNGTGIVSGGHNLIGGTMPGERNIISGNGLGIFVGTGDAPVIEGNFIGTNITGTAGFYTGDGVWLWGGSNGVLGTPGAGNVISGNSIGIRVFASDQVIQGNLIGTDCTGAKAIGNGYAGMYFDSGSNNNIIGGLDTNAPGQPLAGGGNLISGNAGGGNGGIDFAGASSGNIIEGNYVGTDITGETTTGSDGKPLGNVFGIGLGGTNNTIGGTTPAARNVISGNYFSGVGGGFGSSIVEGNYIGTDATGSFGLGNGDGIWLSGATNNTIRGNVISANHTQPGVEGITGYGIFFASGNPASPNSGNVVQDNLIGTDATGTKTIGSDGKPLGNAIGVLVDSNELIGGTAPGAGNVIAGSSGDGVFVGGSAEHNAPGSGNSILRNSIHDNAGLGIDVASGANNNQAAPVLTAAYSGPVFTIITGTITSTPNATFRVEFFANAAGDPEGRTFLTSSIVTTDASGHGSFTAVASGALPAGEGLVTATATDANGNTSEFSVGITATPLPPSSLSGVVWEDFNDDGQVDFSENGISGVTITLTGKDFVGNTVNLSQQTDSDGAYVFLNLLPGSYYLTETPLAGYLQGIDSVGTAGGSLAATDQFFVQLGLGVNGLNYNYGEQPPAGGSVQHGQTAGIGFWNNKNGQALIKAVNGGTGHQLGDWLAATLPNIFGAHAGGSDLAGQGNAAVATLFQSDFLLKGVKLDAQVLATALSVYVTNATLDPTQVAAQYGFTVNGNGAGTATISVGSNGDAFGVANNTTLTLMDLLLATDAQAVNGVLYNGNATRRNEANNVFSVVNQAGDIS